MKTITLKATAALAVITMLICTACPTDGGGPTPDGGPELSGSITIHPDSGVTIGTELTASYDGTGSVSIQWNKNGYAIAGATGWIGDIFSFGSTPHYTPVEGGSYTVTMSKAGYQSKTSAPVTVTDPVGLAWTEVSNSGFSTSEYFDIAYGGGKWVAAGANCKIAISTDGENWTEVSNSGFSTSEYIGTVAYGGGKWVAAGSNGKIVTSTDGENWTAVSNSGFSTFIYRVAYGNSKWLAFSKVEQSANWYNCKMAVSSDGESWTEVDVSNVFNQFQGGQKIEGIVYGGDKWVAVGWGVGIVTSPDGEAWTGVDASSITNQFTGFYGVAYGNNKWVVVGGDAMWGSKGKIAISTNGTDWTNVSNSIFIGNVDRPMYIGVVAYGNNRWVAFGNYGTIAASTDGETWMRGANIPDDLGISSAAYANGKWVVVAGGKIVYANDPQ